MKKFTELQENSGITLMDKQKFFMRLKLYLKKDILELKNSINEECMKNIDNKADGGKKNDLKDRNTEIIQFQRWT